MMSTQKQTVTGERNEIPARAKIQSWLWPDNRAPKASVLRKEHNDTINELLKVEAQRDELLAACRSALADFQSSHANMRTYDLLFDAIARAEGRAE